MNNACRHEDEVKQYFRRNFFAHAIEGGIYMAGITFVARETVLPPILKSLGGPLWIISLAPILSTIGVYLPSIFIVHWIETLAWKKPLLMVTGILQRLPMLIAGLSLIFYAQEFPFTVMVIVALTPLLSGFFCGVSYPAWVELVAKTIPANRRSSVFALRMIIASVVGLGSGIAIVKILKCYPGPTGYGILHLIAFGFLAISYLIFAMIKETNLPPQRSGSSRNMFESFKEIPILLRTDRSFLKLILSRSFRNGIYIAIPFLPLHALNILGKPESFLGYLVMLMVLGAIFGNFFSGYLGDRYGGKICLDNRRIFNP